ncbi:MAG: hypothetical protein JST00_04930 [Deltaproteobacteria bacterium]|nr:hypothetical protein [Deltaproteobacteria bacterium]
MGRSRTQSKVSRRNAREKLRAHEAKVRRRVLAADSEREHAPAAPAERRALDLRARVPGLVPVRPARAWLTLALAVAFALWLGSLGAIMAAAPRGAVGTTAWPFALALVADLVATPLLFLFWAPAIASRALRSSPGKGTNEVVLQYHVPGKGGGAWLSLERPRVVFATTRTLLLMTRFGPRLVPRFVRSGSRVRELTVVNESFALVDAPSPKVRVASEPPGKKRIAVEAERTPAEADAATCVECREPVLDDRAACDLCTDPVHDGACATQHAKRHQGAASGNAYR